LVGLLAALPLYASTPHTVKAILAQAAAAEADRKFDKALDLYLRSYLGGERTVEVREHIHDCLRHAAQTRRHRDPAFRQFVHDLPPGEALNLYAEIVAKLSTHHADKEKAKPERLFALSLQEIERALADRVFRQQHFSSAEPRKFARFTQAFKDEWLQRLPNTAREARAALQQLVRAAQSELGLLEASPLILEAICGACTGLDESTHYISPGEVKAQIPEATVTRAELVDPMSGVGIIAIARFNESTPGDVDAAIARLRLEGMRAVVLDLRGNSGGSFTAAVQLAERFVASGVLTATVGQVPEFHDRAFTSSSGMNALDLPLIVLVDAKTMSAGEVFASAVKDSGRATLIGVNTFGKGSVQCPMPLDEKLHGTLMVTIAKVFTASGAPLHGAGVAPHIVETDPEMQMRLAISRAAE